MQENITQGKLITNAFFLIVQNIRSNFSKTHIILCEIFSVPIQDKKYNYSGTLLIGSPISPKKLAVLNG